MIFILFCLLLFTFHIKSCVFLASLVVVEDDLGIMRGKYLWPRHILVLLDIGVHVYDLSVPFVTEKETCLPTACIHFEVRTIVRRTYSRLPVVVTKISWFRNQFTLSLKDRPEIFSLQSMSIIYISWNLLLLPRNLNPQKYDSQPSSIKNLLFTIS
jgi:hypothetical protein